MKLVIIIMKLMIMSNNVEKNYENMSIKDLKIILKNKKLPVYGKKSELIERLKK